MKIETIHWSVLSVKGSTDASKPTFKQTQIVNIEQFFPLIFYRYLTYDRI